MIRYHEESVTNWNWNINRIDIYLPPTSPWKHLSQQNLPITHPISGLKEEIRQSYNIIQVRYWIESNRSFAFSLKVCIVNCSYHLWLIATSKQNESYLLSTSKWQPFVVIQHLKNKNIHYNTVWLRDIILWFILILKYVNQSIKLKTYLNVTPDATSGPFLFH